jgi:tetratricopeptide (TPR) repeat protein
LLRPDRATVPFTGRGAELDELRAWRASEPARAVRVLYGQAGVGKTRLALETAAEHRADGGESRLVPVGEEADAIRATRATTAGRLLLVVDRAETRPGLDKLLRSMRDDPGPVRVLLIARTLGEWWDQLISACDPAVSRLLTETEPLQLTTGIGENASDVDLAKAAMPHFARALSVGAPRQVTVAAGDRRLPLLIVHAAALVALLRFHTYPVATLRVVLSHDALGELLEHEAKYWLRSASAAGLPAGAVLVKHVLAASSLLGAASIEEASDIVARVPGLSGRPAAERLRWAQWLEELYPADAYGPSGVIQPEMVAETHVVGQLADDPDLAQSCLRGLSAERAEHALAVLARARAHQDDAGALAAPAHRDDPAAPATPPPRTEPRSADREDTATSAHRAPPAGPAAKSAAPAAKSATGAAAEPPRSSRPEDPATEYLEAVAAYRELADTNPGKYRADLATALTNLGLRLSELGRPDEALEAGQEALTIRRQLDETDRDGFRAELATCLVSLGIWYSELGHTDQALKAEQEAVSIRRELVATDPAGYRPDLAASLANLGITLSELGRPAAALSPVGEAVTIYRKLATADPGRYRPDLARCLANLGIRYAGLNRPAEALPPSAEAVTIRRELARVNPDRHRPDLARSLVNLGLRYCELGRATEAVPPGREAVGIYRELAAASPDYRRELARALSGLAAALDVLGRDREAERAEGEAADITADLEQSRASSARLAGSGDPGQYQFPGLAFPAGMTISPAGGG